VVAEGGGVEGVQGWEIGHVLQEDRAFNDMGGGQAGGAKQAFDIDEDLLGLAGEIGGVYFASGGIDGDLTGGEEKLAGAHGLGVGSDGGGGLGGADDFHPRS
jgi:hypothetical protein